MASRGKKTASTGDDAPTHFRARIRMYRHGLGDCFLLTFPCKQGAPFQALIDCGALARDKEHMKKLVKEIRAHVLESNGNEGKACLDAVIGTHEHRDHLSGFNQAREIFNDEFEFKSVWLAWTENLSDCETEKIKKDRRTKIDKIKKMTECSSGVALALDSVQRLMSFSSDDDGIEGRSVAAAFEYLKQRGHDAGDLRFLEPGGRPFSLAGVEGVRVFVLGPPKDLFNLKNSRVTEQMKRDDVVYSLSGEGDVYIDALAAAASGEGSPQVEKAHPFAVEHRFFRDNSPPKQQWLIPNTDYTQIKSFIERTYDDLEQAWRRIDDDWTRAVEQLALALDNDTNNTSLVLAFEFEESGEVLLFPADAQVGSWQSWDKLEFDVGRGKPLPARELLERTVFYKVGHHCSHNATLKKGGLELMKSQDLVAFIPLDIATDENQGAKGWDMPAPALHKALMERAQNRVVISDVHETLSKEAKRAGVVETDTYIDFYLK